MYKHLTLAQVEQAQAELGNSPQDNGILEMIVCRPELKKREVLEQAELHAVEGLLGDNWYTRGSRHTADGNAHPDMQIALMNSRVIQTITRDKSLWPLAGDQLYVDLDLSSENLPPGQRIAIGTAILEITPIPHNGCGKFTERFGHDAIRFVNSPEGRRLHRRGIYARVIQAGTIRVRDTVSKIANS